MDSINGISYYLNKCQTLSNKSQMTSFSFRKTAHWCTCIVRATQSNCCGSVDFLSLKPCPPNSPSWTHWLQDLESHTAAWVWVMSQKDWRNQREIGWILAMHWYSIWVKKKWFSCFPVLPGSAEAHVIWGGIAKRLLIAYFISNISAKKISKCVHVCQSYSNANVGRFFEIECIYICLTSQLMANPQKTARQNSQSTTTFMTIRQNVKTGTN